MVAVTRAGVRRDGAVTGLAALSGLKTQLNRMEMQGDKVIQKDAGKRDYIAWAVG